MRILAIDPSGNYSDREGKGVSGWAFFKDGELKDFGRIEAERFDTLEDYWHEHEVMMDDYPVDLYVCESYKLQPSKAGAQSYSSLETPQLIGFMRMMAWTVSTPFILQDPSIKQRFTDTVLVNTGVATKKGRNHLINGKPSVIHERDAIRHGLYYLRYGSKK